LRGLIGAGDEAFFFHALDDLLDDVAKLGIFGEIGIIQHLLHQFGRKQFAFLQRAQNGFAQFVHHFLARTLGIHFVNPELRFVAALQEEIGETAHQFLKVYIFSGVGRVFRIFRVFHLLAKTP
jgi:hypothetical protein